MRLTISFGRIDKNSRVDIHQLKTFVAVAREGSVTRAADIVHLSQPAVSAHIKDVEDALGVALFERTARGMSLTPEGQRLLSKAEQTLAAHDELLGEATRIKGRLAGKLVLGVSSSSNHEAIGRLLATLSERCPDVEVTLRHASSIDVQSGIRSGHFDAGFYNDSDRPGPEFVAHEVGRFTVHLAAPPGVVAPGRGLDWKALERQTWIYPPESACCGKSADSLFKARAIRPSRIVGVDREDMTRTLIASGIGVGLLHAETARLAEAQGEVQLLFQAESPVRVLFAHLATRATDPVVSAAASIMGSK